MFLLNVNHSFQSSSSKFGVNRHDDLSKIPSKELQEEIKASEEERDDLEDDLIDSILTKSGMGIPWEDAVAQVREKLKRFVGLGIENLERKDELTKRN